MESRPQSSADPKTPGITSEPDRESDQRRDSSISLEHGQHSIFSRLRLVAKIIIYSTLVFSFIFFVAEDYQASLVTHRDGITVANLVSAFAASVDSFAWLVLLAIFEAETWIIDDDALKGWIKWLLGGLTITAYIIILLAFSGYISTVIFVSSYESVPAEICRLIDIRDLSFALKLDQYHPLSKDACNALIDPESLLWHPAAGIVTAADTHSDMIRLVWTDVVNSFCWLLVVIVLQGDIWLQISETRKGMLARFSRYGKGVLYSVLTICCFYWLSFGAILDFADALFWLLAFFLIEMNLIAWAEEISELKKINKSQRSSHKT